MLKTEWKETEMQNLAYTSRDLRRRRSSGNEKRFSHTDPVTGEVYALSFSVDQLKAMLVTAKEKEAGPWRL